MKKIIPIAILGIVLVALIAFFTENRFLLGMPWVNPGKSSWADAQRLLGNRFEPEGFIQRDGVFGHSRIYFVHIGSFILASYEIDFFPRYDHGSVENWISDTDTSWIWVMSRDTRNDLEHLSGHPPTSPQF